MGIPIALAKILKSAGVEISFLGHEESCCGHFARRIGDEYLFQCQAKANIETLKRHNVKKIITACPHCYHTLKYEYPQFGGEFEVVHHTEFILQLIEEGKLKFNTEINKTVAYQDPCYLGRYHEHLRSPAEDPGGDPGRQGGGDGGLPRATACAAAPAVAGCGSRRSRSSGSTGCAPRTPSPPGPTWSSPPAPSASRCSRTPAGGFGAGAAAGDARPGGAAGARRGGAGASGGG